jgi:hypothetical protein
MVLGRNQLLRLLRESATGYRFGDHLPASGPRQHCARRIMQTDANRHTLFARYARIGEGPWMKIGKRFELETRQARFELEKSIIEALADVTHVVALRLITES